MEKGSKCTEDKLDRADLGQVIGSTPAVRIFGDHMDP